jgi:uncharacterized protein
MIFVDSSAWVAAAVQTDSRYIVARAWFAQNQQALLTTDYVMDEVITYLRTRGHRQRATEMGRDLMAGQSAAFHIVTPAELQLAMDVFANFVDKDWSFTDCTSYIVMKQLHIHTACTFDHHFKQFRTVQLVP